MVMRSRRHILEFRNGGGFVSLNRRYFPPDVERREDPLDADRFYSPESALTTIGNVFKERPENYRVRELQVKLADSAASDDQQLEMQLREDVRRYEGDLRALADSDAPREKR
jgi:hypothetical protein